MLNLMKLGCLMKVNWQHVFCVWMEEHLCKNYNLRLPSKMQKLMMPRGSKQVQDHMESDLRSSQLTTLLVVDIFCTTTRAPGNSQGDKHARPESRSSSSPSTFATLTCARLEFYLDICPWGAHIYETPFHLMVS